MRLRSPGRIAGDYRLTGALLTAGVFCLPALAPGALGLAPLPVFYYLVLLGIRRGAAVISAGFLLAGGLHLAVGAAPVLILLLLQMPIGLILAQAARKGNSFLRAGAEASLYGSALLLAFWLIYGAASQTSPYEALVTGLDQGLTAALDHYRGAAGLPKETLSEIESIFAEVRTLAPKILPALLLMTILGTVWINIAAGHRLLAGSGASPWPDYRMWRLPEWLVWGVIVGGVALLAPSEILNLTGLNLLLIFGLLYFFQGLAVIAGLLLKWSVPKLLRAAIYLFFLIQIYGVFLVAVLGLADVWVGFGKPKANSEQEI